MTALFAALVVVWLAPASPATSTTPNATTEADAPVDARGMIKGIVTNTRTQEKIAEVSVVLRASEGTERRTVTSESGMYAFSELPAAEYTVEVHAGKTTVAKIFVLGHDQRFRVNFWVDPESASSRTVRVKSVPHSGNSTSVTRTCVFPTRRDARWERAQARAERRIARRHSRAARARG